MKVIEMMKLPFKNVAPPFVSAGIITVMLFSVVWVVAAAIEGKWIFGINALSDLGACQNDISIILFNYGCVLTGFFGCWFGHGIMKYEKNWLFFSGLATCVGTVLLMGVGAIPETLGQPHMFCAGAFGALGFIAIVLSAIGDYKKGMYHYTVISLILVAVIVGITTASTILDLPFGLYEAIDIICILVWVATQSSKYLLIIGFVDIIDPIKEKFDLEHGLIFKPKE